MTRERRNALCAHAIGSGPEARNARRQLERGARDSGDLAAMLRAGLCSELRMEADGRMSRMVLQRLAAQHDLHAERDQDTLRITGNPGDIWDFAQRATPLASAIESLEIGLLAVLVETIGPAPTPSVPPTPEAESGPPADPEAEEAQAPPPTSAEAWLNTHDDALLLVETLREAWGMVQDRAQPLEWPTPPHPLQIGCTPRPSRRMRVRYPWDP